jgi:prolyl-tRNA synthetase
MSEVEHEIKINGHRFKFGLRDVVQTVVTILAAVGLYFSLSIKTSQNSQDIESSKKDRDKIWATIQLMQEHGTTHSHETDEKQQQTIDSLVDNYRSLNHEMRDLSPKVDKIDTNVLWLMAKQLEHR